MTAKMIYDPSPPMTDPSDDGLKHRILSALKWTVIARSSSQIVTWVITLVVIRVLEPSDYGLMAMSQVITGLLLLLGSSGMGSALEQARHLAPQDVRRVFGLLILLNGALFVITFCAAPLLAAYYRQPAITDVIRALAGGFLLAPFRAVPEALLNRDIDFRRRSLLDVGVTIVSSLAVLYLASRGYGVWALVVGTLGAQLLGTIGINIIRPYAQLPSFRLSGIGNLLAFGGWHTAATIVWYFYSQADILIAGRYLSAADVGYYSVGIYLSSLVLSKLMPLINQVALPAYSRVNNEHGTVAYYLKRVTNAASLICFPVFLGLSCLAPLFIEVVVPKYWGSVLPLVFLCFLMPIRLLSYLLPSAVYAIGKPQVEFQSTVFAAVLTTSSFLVGVHWGLLGLCVAWMASFPVAFAYQLRLSGRVLGLNSREYLRQTIPSLASALGMAAAVLLARNLLSHWPVPAVIQMLTLILFGAVSYVAIVLAAYPDAANDALSLFSLPNVRTRRAAA